MEKLTAILMFLFVCISIASVYVNGYHEVVGGKSEVKDLKTNKELGKFSVEEFNRSRRRGGGGGGYWKLRFSQVVAGMKYYLKIDTVEKEKGKKQIFYSVVVIKPWVHYKELLDFSTSVSM